MPKLHTIINVHFFTCGQYSNEAGRHRPLLSLIRRRTRNESSSNCLIRQKNLRIGLSSLKEIWF